MCNFFVQNMLIAKIPWLNLQVIEVQFSLLRLSVAEAAYNKQMKVTGNGAMNSANQPQAYPMK